MVSFISCNFEIGPELEKNKRCIEYLLKLGHIAISKLNEPLKKPDTMKNLLLLLSIFALFSCQNEPQNGEEASSSSTAAEELPIRGNLFVRFIEDDKHLKAEAYFFQGNDDTDTRPKSFARGVKFLGSGMGERRVGDKYVKYQYENNMDWRQEGYFFTLTDDEGREHRFSFTEGVDHLQDFELPKTIYKDKTNYISFTPAHLPEGEQIAVLITDSNNKAATTKVKGPSEEGKITLTPEMLKNLSTGKAEAYLVHIQSKRIEEPPFSLSFTIEYYTPLKKTIIK